MPKVTPIPIRYRPDGSIDTAYHMQAGRRLRSEKAHDLLGRAIAPPAPARPAGFHWLTRLLRPLALR